MTPPLEFDAVDCFGEEKALNAGGTVPAASAKPAHSRRSRRVSGAGPEVLNLLDLDFMLSASCELRLSVIAAKSFAKSGSANLRGNGFTQTSRAGFPADIWRAHLGFRENCGNCRLDGIRTFYNAEMTEHHGAGPDLADGIGNAFSSDIRRRTVDRLKHRRKFLFRIEICGRSDANGSNYGWPKIGEDVAKKIGPDHDVEPIGMTHEVSGENVDVILIGADVWIFGG